MVSSVRFKSSEALIARATSDKAARVAFRSWSWRTSRARSMASVDCPELLVLLLDACAKGVNDIPSQRGALRQEALKVLAGEAPDHALGGGRHRGRAGPPGQNRQLPEPLGRLDGPDRRRLGVPATDGHLEPPRSQNVEGEGGITLPDQDCPWSKSAPAHPGNHGNQDALGESAGELRALHQLEERLSGRRQPAWRRPAGRARPPPGLPLCPGGLGSSHLAIPSPARGLAAPGVTVGNTHAEASAVSSLGDN